jgi:HEAT repeat protein
MKRTFTAVPLFAIALALPRLLPAQAISTREASRIATSVVTSSAIQSAVSIATSIDVASAVATANAIVSQVPSILSMASNALSGTTSSLGSTIVIPSNMSFEVTTQGDADLRAAKEVMNEGDFREAARLFARIAERYPRTAQAPEALYWRAFSMYRIGNSSNLTGALASLNDLNRLYPSSTFNTSDGRSLRVRVCGELAQRGDEACAREVVSTATGSGQGSGGGQGSGQSSGQTSGQNCPRDDDDNDERIMALNALINMNSESAVPILEKVLARKDDCSKALRKKAVFLISQKRTDNVVDILIKVAREDPSSDVREQAVFWLSNVRDPRVVDLLAEMANSGDKAIQEKAIFSLSNTRSERASQILRDIAQRDGAPKNAREQAIFWLGNRRDTDAQAFLKELYTRLTDKDLKERVLFSVANQRATGSGEWLINIAMNERETMELRKQALFWAGNNRAATVTEIAALYDRVRDREMKEQVIFVLSQNRAEAAVDKLMSIARSDSDRELRSKAVFWLGQSRDPRVIKFLEDLINR